MQRTGVEMANLARDLESVFTSGGVSRARRSSTLPSIPLRERAVPNGATYVLRFDGSYQGGNAAGVGISIEFEGQQPFAQFSVPLSVLDAQRAEICGPVLGSLLLGVISPSRLFIEGDSKYVIGLLERAF